MPKHDDRRERNLERMREAVERKGEEARAQAEEHSLLDADRRRDETGVQAKGPGDEKQAADERNQ
jgi:hypothetical protein